MESSDPVTDKSNYTVDFFFQWKIGYLTKGLLAVWNFSQIGGGCIILNAISKLKFKCLLHGNKENTRKKSSVNC